MKLNTKQNKWTFEFGSVRINELWWTFRHNTLTTMPKKVNSLPDTGLKTVSTSALKGCRRTCVKAQVNSAVRAAQLVQPWAPSPASHRPSTWEVKARGWGAPGFPPLCIQFQTSLGCRRHHLRKQMNTQTYRSHWKPMCGAHLTHLKSQSSYVCGCFYCIFKGIATDNLRHPKDRRCMENYLRCFR